MTLPIHGKGKALFSRLYEFNPRLVRQVVAAYFGVDLATACHLDLSDVPEIPQRPPNLCAGCSHRATFYAVKKAAEGMQTIYPTDIGCYTLGFMPPLSMGDFLICMGSSAGTSCGFSKVTDKKVVSFIGDSTFFHSGIPGLVNAVFNNHNFTFVILDNGITAMTGHQPNPGVDMGLMNLSGIRTDLDRGRCPGPGRCPCCGHSALQGEKEHRSAPRSLQFQRGVGCDRAGNVHPVRQRALKKPSPAPIMSAINAGITATVSANWPVRPFIWKRKG